MYAGIVCGTGIERRKTLAENRTFEFSALGDGEGGDYHISGDDHQPDAETDGEVYRVDKGHASCHANGCDCSIGKLKYGDYYIGNCNLPCICGKSKIYAVCGDGRSGNRFWRGIHHA